MGLIITIVMLVFVGLFIFMQYNKIVRLKVEAEETSSNIDIQLKRRSDLIPNLVNTVKGYAKHEEETFTKITQLRQQMMNPNSSMNDKMEANNQLTNTMTHLFAVAENYPELKANTNFLNLQEELANTENKVSYSRSAYNSCVTNYNTAITMFPGNIFAKMFHFEKKEFIKIAEAEREVPKVEF